MDATPDTSGNGASNGTDGQADPAAHRDAKGRFTKNNPGGPGRPSLKIEREYMEALTSVVSLEDWRAIVRFAVEQAKKGDDKARLWLAKYCLGKDPPSLKDLKVKEDSGITAEEEVRREAAHIKSVDMRVEEFCKLLGGGE